VVTAEQERPLDVADDAVDGVREAVSLEVAVVELPALRDALERGERLSRVAASGRPFVDAT
jgi:hypothetical protein